MRSSFLCALLVACSSNNDGADGGDASADAAQEASPMGDCGGATCKRNEQCVSGSFCACVPGFVPDTVGCAMAQAGSPAAHTQQEVCDKWKSGHVVTTPSPFQAGAAACDPGTLAPGGVTDSLVRLNMFRWMVGLSSDVKDDATLDQADQACSVIQANNPLSHTPPMSSVCYNALGAMAAGQSNLAFGTSCADAIDGYIQDSGANNVGSLGHRRWCLHPSLGKVGVGYYEAQGKRAECLGVFDTSGTGPSPLWYSWPPSGYVPIQVLSWAWSFHYAQANVIGADIAITVKNLATSSDAPVTITQLGKGYGDDAVSFSPNGWAPKVGEIYRVSVNPKKVAPLAYDVIPVTCP